MSSGKVKCTCGWSWNKSDSSAKDMYICHECGRDNSNNMKNGGWLDSYDKAQDGSTIKDKPKLGAGKYYTTTGDIVDWGTPEYERAYNKGEVLSEDGVRSEVTLEGGVLPEVVLQNNYKRGFWEKYRDKIIEENKDTGVLGAIIGTPISAITSLPQLAATYGITGEMQRPSEAMDIENPYGAFAVDAVTDPTNLIGVGELSGLSKLTKENALAKLANIRNIKTSVAPELTEGLATQGFPNPLGIVDKVVPRPPTPGMFFGMEDSWNNYSPLNWVAGYGEKLSAASSHPNFVGFRKFGNSIQDVIESQSLRPKGTGMGSKQIMSEGNWAEPGKVNENYSGVFEATMNPQIKGSNIKLEKWNKRNGIVGTTQEGDVAIPLTDPGLSFNRRLPFSNRYIPIDKERLINNKFQLATQLPYAQSLAEKYGLWAGLAGGAGYISGGDKGAQENIDLLNKYTVDPIINYTKPQLKKANKQFQDLLNSTQKQNGGILKNSGWLDSYADGGTMQEHQENYNDSYTYAPEGMIGDGFSNVGRNYSPAWGGQFQEGGDIPNAQSGEYFKKKNIKEQNITEKDNLKINIPIQKEQTKKQKIKSSINDQSRFMKDWMNSPMYDKMVDNSTTGYFDKQYLNSGRNSNFNNTGVQLQHQPKLSPNTGADSNNQTGLIRLFPLGTESDALEGMVAHEYSHSSDRPINWKPSLLDKFKPVNKYDNDKLGLGDEEEVRLIPEKDINLMKLFYSDNKSYKNLFNKSALKDKDLNKDREWFNYVSEPTETRARLNDIRYNAKKYNIYDPFTQKVTPEILNKIKELTKKAGGFNPFMQLKSVYSDDEIIHLLNNISQNEQPNQNPNIATAKNGRIIKDDRGQWDHPGEITEINSNEITMEPDPKTGKPLTKPLLGISDTGDVKLMRPGGNYKFDGKRVTEYPIAQGGLTMGTTSTENDARESSGKAAKANTEVKKQAKLDEAKLLAEQEENRKNRFARDIKMRQPDGTIKIVNTGSPEYAEMYKAGNIQSPGAGEGDTPFFGGQLNDVVVQQKMTPLLKGKKDYGYLSNKEAFVNRKKDEYIKSLGSRGNWFGATRNNFPETVLSRINREYDYNQNTRAIEDVAKAKGFDLNTRGEWIYNLTPGEKEALINSKYSAQLNPNEFSEMASGVQQLANTVVPGKPWNFKIPGLTERELEEDRESWMSPLKIAAPLNMPGNFIANSFTNIPGSDVVDTPWFGMQRQGDVSALEAMALNPLNLTMVEGAANLLTRGLPALAKGVPAAARTIGKGVNLAIENAPAAVNFAADAIKDVRGVVKQYKEIGKIKNQDDYYNSVVNTSKYIDDLPKTGIDASNTITDVNDLNSVMRTIANNYMSYLKRMGGEEFAIKEARKWEKNFDTSDFGTRVSDVLYNGKQVSVDELRQLGREFSNSFPKGKSLIAPAKNELAKIQKNIIFNRDKDYDTLKEFAKNLKIKVPKTVTEYSPQERETISAIRELGKYKNVAAWRTNTLLSDPEAMVNINKLILKLDDDVIQNLLGISKGKLLDSYKNIVPNIKKTQVDITSNPIPTADLSLVNEQNLVQPSGVSDIHPFNEKQLIASDPKYQSLMERIGQSYAKNFEPVNYEIPSSNPQGLIGMAKTDYEYRTITDAQGNLVEKLLPTGKTKEQLIGAFRKVEASPKGTNFIGSSSLSTDSYPLTLDSGLMMSEKGLVDVSVDTGTIYLNDMGYTHTSPRLVIKDINSKIEKLEKISGKKFPRAKYNPKADRYHMYEVPKIYFTRLKQGGSINKTDENSLVKLDQLTNFTNYNKPQPGGWLSKYE